VDTLRTLFGDGISPNARRVHTLALIQDRASDLWMPSKPLPARSRWPRWRWGKFRPSVPEKGPFNRHPEINEGAGEGRGTALCLSGGYGGGYQLGVLLHRLAIEGNWFLIQPVGYNLQRS
jgi:hypothetical protein